MNSAVGLRPGPSWPERNEGALLDGHTASYGSMSGIILAGESRRTSYCFALQQSSGPMSQKCKKTR